MATPSIPGAAPRRLWRGLLAVVAALGATAAVATAAGAALGATVPAPAAAPALRAPAPLRDAEGVDAPAGLAPRRALLGGWAAAGSLPAAFADASPPVVGGDTLKLNNGLVFPKASFGLQVYDDNTAKQLTEIAISVGFRNFFASVLARNQRGFALGVQASGVPREELFICGSVLSNNARGFDDAYRVTKRGCEDNLRAFAAGGIFYVDQIMLDYPADDCDSIKGQWKAFEEMLAAGQTKSLAVSNFSPAQLDCLLADKTATVPTVNQLPYSVTSFDASAVAENKKRGIVVQAWSPLGGGRFSRSALSACREIGAKYGKSAYQVALRWIIDTGATFSTQSRNKDHFKEDLDIFDFSLTAEEIQRLSSASR